MAIVGTGVYGLSQNKSTGALARLGDAAALTRPANTAAIAAFSAAHPFGDMVRCNLWNDGTVTALYGDRCYTDSDVANMGQAMVRIPKFYYYTDYAANVYRWFVTTDPTATIDGYAVKVHPAFVRNGAPKDYAYMSAFEGYYNPTTTILESRAGVQPTGYMSLAQFRTAAHQRVGAVDKWECCDFQTLQAALLLAFIEYGCTDIQACLGVGITNAAAGTINHSSNTGHTTALGNASGQVLHTFDHYAGTGDTTGYALSYRGIENLYGNTLKFVDGLNIKADYHIWIADHGFVSPVTGDTSTGFGGAYADTTYLFNSGSSVVIDIVYGANLDYSFIPATVSGDTTKWNDWSTGATANGIPIWGGRWSSTWMAGLTSMGIYAPTTYIHGAGTRLTYIG